MRLTKQMGGTEKKKGDVKQTLQKKHTEQWEREIHTASRLQFYTEIKEDYKMEEYLNYEHRKVRRTYTKYRVSDHNLQIEKERWTTKTRQDGGKKGI